MGTEKRIGDTDLKLGGFHGDWNANEDDAGHGDGSVALPVLWPAVRATGHGPDLLPEVAAVVSSSGHGLHSSSAAESDRNRSYLLFLRLVFNYYNSNFNTGHLRDTFIISMLYFFLFFNS